MAKRMARIVISSLMMGSPGTQIWAGSWSTTGEAQLGASHDDNIRFSTSNLVSAASVVSEVSGQLAYQDDTKLWSINPRLLAVRYDGERSYDRTEKYLTIAGRSAAETSSSNIALSGTEDTTLTSELGLTGLSEVNKKHRSGSATLASQWNLSELLSVNGQVYGIANQYVDAGQTGLVDYNYGSALLGVGYQLNQTSTLTLQISGGKLQVPERRRLDKTNVSLSLGYEFDWSPRWHSSLSAGPSQIRTEGGSQSGSIYAAALTHTAERSSLALSLRRDVTPNGVGSLTRREQIQLGWNLRLTERWSTDWSATAVRNQDVLSGDTPTQVKVEYADVSASFSYSITPTWRTSLALGHSLQRLAGDQPTAKRNHASLNVSWNGLAHALH